MRRRYCCLCCGLIRNQTHSLTPDKSPFMQFVAIATNSPPPRLRRSPLAPLPLSPLNMKGNNCGEWSIFGEQSLNAIWNWSLLCANTAIKRGWRRRARRASARRAERGELFLSSKALSPQHTRSLCFVSTFVAILLLAPFSTSFIAFSDQNLCAFCSSFKVGRDWQTKVNCSERQH